ncbi:cyclopropane fatty acyl phospholipid synthase [Pelomonas cellulosilytica]|uniref:Cyclopropane fatty acyl phospholipid synthase n=1 Tax=Pelomonas cellulosilytica TaxID=2906762 RepID=A0ABS8XXH3_9BURK|nr:cyclopropane fatty acyl phospholipid synthase [Pelomonas sp. P8]MCE4556400.1 cyclopropane fatty acyl phospholipid synthase [Pelomonas sp. P8]
MQSEQAALTRPRRPQPQPAAHPPQVLRELLARADVQINGTRPWDMRVHDARAYRRILAHWSLGAGESYVDGDWDCERLDMMFERLIRAELDRTVPGLARLKVLAESLRQRLFNLQTAERAHQVGERHYDAGNDVFEAMLDARMIYSCAYWGAGARNLEQAQEHKLEMICRKLELQPGETLLDIGCGWGGLARFAAQRHGARVTGVTISREQLALAEQRCEGLPVTLLLQDYRSLQGRFDKIVSVGMFEHVGLKNYGLYFDTARRLLAPDGLFLLHSIGVDRSAPHTDPWIERYIFPNGKLPSPRELADEVEGRFVIEDWHNFGTDYDRTLMCWAERFEAAWPRLAPRYDEAFRRMFRYYLLSCAGFFRSRQGQLWQLVLTRPERRGAYRSFRPQA